jgi:cell division protein FtsQ
VVFVITLPFRILAFALARRWGRRFVALAALVLALAGGYRFWLRDSPWLAIRQVQVTGVSASEPQRIRVALAEAARGMTVLHVDRDALLAAVRSYPIVRSIEVDPSFPSGLAIRVIEHRPTALVRGAGRSIPVAADGTLLPGVSTQGQRLPEINVERAPSGRRLTGTTLDEALVLGAAPADLRPAIESSGVTARGLTVYMAGGIRLDFGDRSSLAAKWAAAARILADENLDSLAYIDLRAPRRPSVGGAPGGSYVSSAGSPPVAEVGPPAGSVATEPQAPVAAGEDPSPSAPAAPSGGVSP